MCLNNLATVDIARARYSDAEPLLSRAVKIDEKALGPDHPEVATDLNSLAVVYSKEGRYADAEPVFQRILAIHEKMLGAGHPDLATDLTNFGLLYEYQDKYAQAEPLFQRAFDNLFQQFQYEFAYMTEKERLGFLDTVADDFPAYFSFVHRFHDKDPELIGSMYNLLLWEKGFVAGSVADMRRQIEASGDAEALKLVNELTEKRTQIASLLNQQPQDRDAWRKQIGQLRAEADETEKALVARSSTFAERRKLERATWQQVRDELKPGDAAVEFARFRFYDKDWTGKSYYAALVVTHETKDEPEYVFLGADAQIEGDAITHFQQQLRTRGVVAEPTAALPGQGAYAAIWKPLEPALNGVKRIYLSPDGVLNQIPLGIIPSADGALEMEKYDLRVVSSTRDILRAPPAPGAGAALLVGDPLFSLSEDEQRAALEKMAAVRPESDGPSTAEAGELSRDGGSGTALPPLPGTGAEVAAIAQLMQQKQWKTEIYTGDRALKSVVEEASSPRVMHLATHGFFLPDQQINNSQFLSAQPDQKAVEDASGDQSGGREDPMLRSGLYFAGADRTLQGKPAAKGLDNGVLTALEAGNLNLAGTELVVLSACNTGQGDVKNGEGVFGLRRALQEAGASEVLMSLWSVPDQETLELMKQFYANWLGGMEVHESLRRAQLDMREKVKTAHDGKDLPFYWGAFVLVGP
jgi:CHAT domain-containing protein